MTPRSGPPIGERVEALERAIVLAESRLAPGVVAAAVETAAKVRGRMGHGSEHTVVAIAGATGVGKSSLFNAIAGAEVSLPGVRRPTTDATHAAIWGEGDPSILDWLGVRRRHHVPGDAGGLAGLVVLDLPDFDSIDADNRTEMSRIIELVDLVVWVTDPQKYADELFHDGFVRPLADHHEIMRFVINRADVVRAADRSVLAADLADRLRDDGVPDPHVLVTSARDGSGLDALRAALADAVAARSAMTARLIADVRAAAARMATSGEPVEVTKSDRRAFVDRLTSAAGGDRIPEIVAAEHRHQARMAMGWPPAKLVARWGRRHPIADLPRAGASSIRRSEIDVALRDVAEAAADGVDPPWPTILRSTAAAGGSDLVSGLDALGGRTARDTLGRPGWWAGVQALQAIVTGAAVVGALWLLAVAALGGFFQFDVDPLLIDTPGWDWIPLPSLLVLGGLLLGLVLALLVRLPVSASARRRGAAARRSLASSVADLVDRTVLTRLAVVIAERRELQRLLAVAAAPR